MELLDPYLQNLLEQVVLLVDLLRVVQLVHLSLVVRLVHLSLVGQLEHLSLVGQLEHHDRLVLLLLLLEILSGRVVLRVGLYLVDQSERHELADLSGLLLQAVQLEDL